MKPALKPATSIINIKPSTLRRNQVLGLEYEYLLANLRFLLLDFLPMKAKKSCITPNGQITEQYRRPKSKVRASTATTEIMFRASTLGRNCSLAIQPSQGCTVPEKSRNSKVMPTKKIAASRILVLCNIKGSIMFSAKILYFLQKTKQNVPFFHIICVKTIFPFVFANYNSMNKLIVVEILLFAEYQPIINYPLLIINYQQGISPFHFREIPLANRDK